MMRIFRLVLLLAVLLMPHGMAGAEAQHHSQEATMPMEHCPAEGSTQDSTAGFGACTMACSAALPAAEMPQDRSLLIVCTPQRTGIVGRLQGIHPDTATPPPKRS